MAEPAPAPAPTTMRATPRRRRIAAFALALTAACATHGIARAAGPAPVDDAPGAPGCPAAAADAAPGTSVFLEDLTSPELAGRVRRGATIALVPVGGTEQSGAHLVLGKHDARVRVLAGRIACALGDAIVAPVLAYVPEGSIDPPTGHMRFPGTISIPEPAFESLLEGAARSLRRAGFRDVFLLGDHGGYQAALRRVAARLAHEKSPPGAAPFHVHALDTYYRTTQTAYVEALRRRGYSAAEIGEHAGVADTSLSMALAPAGVRAAALAPAARPQAQPGVNGDPRRSSVALGQLGARLVVEQSVAAIRAEAGRP